MKVKQWSSPGLEQGSDNEVRSRYSGYIKKNISVEATQSQGIAEIIATTKVFGGFSALLTKRHRIRYASDLMRSLPISEGAQLTHPDLVAIVDEAWRSREQITRPYHGDTLGPLRDAVAQAAVVGGRWVLLTLADRTSELEADRVRRDFVSNTGHELRTPVTSVGLIAQALQASKDDPASVEHFAVRLTEVAGRLERLTDAMLQLAVAQHSPKVVSELVDIDEIVDQAIARTLEQANAARVILRRKKRAHVRTRGDQNALVLALENLIANAIYYSPRRSQVTVVARPDEAEGTVSMDVIDEGIGIHPEDQDRVFERFYRADEARSARAGGTGLGLAIVKNTVLAHGGSVHVDSRLGIGSTFTMTLPLASKEESND